MLGIFMAAGFSVSLMENQALSKVDACIAKMSDKHLSLAARVIVANGLILSSLWYLITLWAGDLAFFTRLQNKIEAFVWAGRRRVDMNTIAQCKLGGGLGLLTILDQYKAIARGIMILTLGPGHRPPAKKHSHIAST